VITQSVDPLTKNAIIVFATNLIYPYTISTDVLTANPGLPMTYQLGAINDGQTAALCPNTVGSTCTQRFQLNITTNTACQITGEYGIQFGLVCQPGTAQCPIDNGVLANVTASIISEDFCAKVSTFVNISGALGSYTNNTYSLVRSIFLVEQIGYFKATVVSPQATLTQSTISTVSVVNVDDSTESYLIYNNGIVPQFADSCKFTLDTAGPDFAEFYFTLNSTVFNNATNSDVTKNFKVQVRVNVEYAGVPGSKRVILQQSLNTRQMSFNTNFQMAPNSLVSNPSNTSGSSSLFVNFALMFTILFSLALWKF
jgi:hypothetical protein